MTSQAKLNKISGICLSSLCLLAVTISPAGASDNRQWKTPTDANDHGQAYKDVWAWTHGRGANSERKGGESFVNGEGSSSAEARGAAGAAIGAAIGAASERTVLTTSGAQAGSRMAPGGSGQGSGAAGVYRGRASVNTGSEGAGERTGANAGAALISVKDPLLAEKKKNSPASAAGIVDKKKAALDSYIDGQVKRERDRYDRYYKGLERNALETGKYKAAQTRATINPSTVEQWSRDKDKNYVPLHERIPGYVPTSLNNGRGGNIGDGKVRPYADSASTSQEIEWARMKEQMAEEKAEEYRKRAGEKKALLEESASNLKTQMQESHVPGAAIVKPHGSNLYVRYYGSDEQARKAVDVRPAAARIVPHQ